MKLCRDCVNRRHNCDLYPAMSNYAEECKDFKPKIGDLISRSALLNKIQKDKEFLQKGSGKDSEYAYMSIDSVVEKINSMPATYDIGKTLVCNCTGCKHSKTGECLHCMRAYSDCYEST